MLFLQACIVHVAAPVISACRYSIAGYFAHFHLSNYTIESGYFSIDIINSELFSSDHRSILFAISVLLS